MSTKQPPESPKTAWYDARWWQYTKSLLIAGVVGLVTYVATISIFSDLTKFMSGLGAAGSALPIVSGIFAGLAVVFTLFDEENKVTGFFSDIKKHWKDLSNPEFTARYGGLIFGVLFTLAFFAASAALLYFSLPFSMPAAITLAVLTTVVSATGAAHPILNFFKGLPARLSATYLRLTNPNEYRARFHNEQAYKKSPKSQDSEEAAKDTPTSSTFKERAEKTSNPFIKIFFYTAALSVLFTSHTKKFLKTVLGTKSKTTGALMAIFLWVPNLIIDIYKKFKKSKKFSDRVDSGKIFTLKNDKDDNKAENDKPSNDADLLKTETLSDELTDKPALKPIDKLAWNKASWGAQLGLQGVALGMGIATGLTFVLAASFPPALLIPMAIITAVFTYLMAMNTMKEMYNRFLSKDEPELTLEEAHTKEETLEKGLTEEETNTPQLRRTQSAPNLTLVGKKEEQREHSKLPSPSPLPKTPDSEA